MTKEPTITRNSANFGEIKKQIDSGEVLSKIMHRVGHDIGNPLTAIITLASVLERVPPGSDKVASYANMINSEAWKISDLNERLVLLLSKEPLSPEACSIEELIDASITRLQSRLGKTSLDSLVLEQELPNVLADIEQTKFLFSELFRNALIHSDEKDSIALYAIDEAGSVTICIENPFNKQQLHFTLGDCFLPLVSSKSEQKHLGLGLTICSLIADRLNASLEIYEKHVEGRNYFGASVTFPKADSKESSLKKPEVKNNQEKAYSSLSVLIIEDENIVSSAIENILSFTFSKEGSVRIDKATGSDALQMLNGAYDAILCDLRLRDISGIDIYRHILEQKPGIKNKFAFITGNALDPAVEMFILAAKCKCLKKPFEPSDLIETVNALRQEKISNGNP